MMRKILLDAGRKHVLSAIELHARVLPVSIDRAFLSECHAPRSLGTSAANRRCRHGNDLSGRDRSVPGDLDLARVGLK